MIIIDNSMKDAQMVNLEHGAKSVIWKLRFHSLATEHWVKMFGIIDFFKDLLDLTWYLVHIETNIDADIDFLRDCRSISSDWRMILGNRLRRGK